METSWIAVEDLVELATPVSLPGGGDRVDTTGDMCLQIAVAVATYSGPTGPHH